MSAARNTTAAAIVPVGMSDIDFRHGRWQDVLSDVECDACIFDAPWGAETHDRYANAGAMAARSRQAQRVGILDYASMSHGDVSAMVDHWSQRTRWWMCSITDHNLAPVWEAAFRNAGRLPFCPIPIVDAGSRARLAGDGPSNWTSWLVVARPRGTGFSTWGTLPGAYIRSPGDERSARMGGKPLGVMRAIVRDYSRPDDLVCDPFAGGGTTLLAAVMDGRRAVGSECDREAYAEASARLRRGYTIDMFAGAEHP
jgi:hypothetical protein